MLIILPEKVVITTTITQSYEELPEWCLDKDDRYVACGKYYRYVLRIAIIISDSLENEIFFKIYDSVEEVLEKMFKNVDGCTSWRNNFIAFKVELENPIDIKNIEKIVRETMIRELFDYCEEFGCEVVER